MKLSQAIFLNSITFATSFLTKPASFHRNNVYQPSRRDKNVDQNSMLFALILDWNDDSESSSYSYDGQQHDIFQEEGQGRWRAIATKLTESREKLSSFARLAVTHAPQGHAPTLSDIERVEITSVDEHHLEMCAVICEDDGCVTIFESIDFPKYCGSDDMEECVLDNIFELDMQAQDQLREIERNGGQRQLTDEEIEERNALYSDARIVLPSWWVPAGSFMQEECETLKKLLNEDRFQTEVNALARKGLDVMDGGHLLTVLNTAVAVVGPAGFYFRAKTERTNQILDEGTSIIDIPLSFSNGVVAENSSDLRSNALQTLNDAM